MSWIPPSAAGLYDPQSERAAATDCSQPPPALPPQPPAHPPAHPHPLAAGHTAPRPAAAAPPFTFGRYEEKKQAQEQQRANGGTLPPAVPISQRPEKACFDQPLDSLRWWQQPRSAATVAGASNRDIEAFWAGAQRDKGAVEALLNVAARQANKSVGVGSNVAASLGDREQFSLAQAQSCYKSDMLAGHQRVGKRGVVQSAAAMQAASAACRGWAGLSAAACGR